MILLFHVIYIAIGFYLAFRVFLLLCGEWGKPGSGIKKPADWFLLCGLIVSGILAIPFEEPIRAWGRTLPADELQRIVFITRYLRKRVQVGDVINIGAYWGPCLIFVGITLLIYGMLLKKNNPE